MGVRKTLLCGTADGVIRLPNQRGLTISKTLSGGFSFEIERAGAVEIRPDQAFEVACGILRDLGCNMNFDYAAAKKAGLVK